MPINYPDILGEYITAPIRFEIDGLQYVGQFAPSTIAPGEIATLQLFLQNTLNVPLSIELRPHIPQIGRFRTQPVLALGDTLIELTLDEAEVGVENIPVTTTNQIVPGTFSLEIEFKVKHPKNAAQIRAPKPDNPLKSLPIADPVGLDLISVVGATYKVKNGKKANFSVTISNDLGEEAPTDNLKPTYKKLWDRDMAHIQHQAQQEINKIRATILKDLAIEPLFVALYAETQQRFVDAGLPLRIGEAIALGKLLTYTCQLFLKQSNLQDGLLCPIWERALFNNYPTTDIRKMMRDVGYRHIVRLSIALSFGLIGRVAGSPPWSKEEQSALMEYVVDALEEGLPLEPDFLYLPLMLGALIVVKNIQLPGEDMAHTVRLIKQAREARQNLFEDQDLVIANRLYASFLQKALKVSSP